MSFLHAIKQPTANVDYTLDWQDALSGGETITASTWVGDTGITLGTTLFTGSTTTVFIAGGTAGKSYKATNTVVTSGGRTLVRTLALTIQSGNARTPLWVTYDSLRREAGRFLGFHRDPHTWNANEIQDVDDVVDTALGMVHTPPVLPGERFSHAWSFLRPTTTLAITVGVEDYDLPDDFAAVEGPVTLLHPNSTPYEIDVVPDWQIRQWRQLYSDVSSSPTKCAIVPLISEGLYQQKYQLLVYPKPDGSYSAQLRYHARQPALRNENQVPLGGAEHSELFRAAVLAAAEAKLDDELGPKHELFMQRLAASVSLDRRSNSPGNLGPNLDATAALEDWPCGGLRTVVNLIIYQKYPIDPIIPPPPDPDPDPDPEPEPGDEFDSGLLTEDGFVLTTEDGFYLMFE